MSINIPTSVLSLTFQISSLIAVVIALVLGNWMFLAVSVSFIAASLIWGFMVRPDAPPPCDQPSAANGVAARVAGSSSDVPRPMRFSEQQMGSNSVSQSPSTSEPESESESAAKLRRGLSRQQERQQVGGRSSAFATLPPRAGYDTRMYDGPMDLGAVKAAYAAQYGIDVIRPPVQDENEFLQFLHGSKIANSMNQPDAHMVEVFE